MIQNAGSQLVGTTDAAVQASGKAVRVFMIHIISGTAAIVSLRNGTAATATAYATETGTANTGKTIVYGEQGLAFPAGCFVDVDVNTTSVLVTYCTLS